MKSSKKNDTISNVSDSKIESEFANNLKGLANVDSIILLTITAFLTFVIFLFYKYSNAKIQNYEESQFFSMKNEYVIICIISLISGILALNVWKLKIISERPIWFFNFLVLVSFVINEIVKKNKNDNSNSFLLKNTQFEGYDLEKRDDVIILVFLFFSISCFLVNFLKKNFRIDKLNFLSEEYIGYFIGISVIIYFLCLVFSKVVEIAKLYSNSENDFTLKYLLISIGILTVFVLIDIIFTKLQKMFNFIGKTEENEKSKINPSYISDKSTGIYIKAVFLLIFFLVSYFFYKENNIIQIEKNEKQKEDSKKSIKKIGETLLLALPFIFISTSVLLKLEGIFPAVYNFIAIAIIAALMFFIPVNFFQFSDKFSIILFAIIGIIGFSYLFSNEQIGFVSSSLLFSGLVVLVKYFTGVIVNEIELTTVLTENQRLFIWLIPTLLIGVVLVSRSIIQKSGYGFPLIFSFFSIFYGIIYYLPEKNVTYPIYFEKKSTLANAGFDCIILAALILVVLSFSTIFRKVFLFIEKDIFIENLPVLVFVGTFIFYVLIGYSASLAYDKFIESSKVKSYIEERQMESKKKIDLLQNDLKNYKLSCKI